MITSVDLTLKNESEFNKMLKDKDIKISKIIVNSIIKNLTTQKKKILVLSAKIIDEDKIIDLELEKDRFILTLEENLENLEKAEEYEMCSQIKNSIQKLKQ